MRADKQLQIALMVLMIAPAPVYAFGWDDLWKRQDQQFNELLEQGDYEQAQSHATSVDDDALVKYRAGDYEGSAALFEQSNRDYNRATALTRAGDYQAALEAYDQVLADSDDYEDAMHNRKIAQKLAELQQQQQGEGEQGGESGESSEQQEGSQNQPADSNPEGDSGEQSDQSNQDSNEQGSQGQDPADGDEQQDDNSADQAPSEQPQEQQEQSPGQPEPTDSKAHDEKQQAMDQWLQQVPDDPAGLLRARIIREHQRSYGGSRDQEQAW